MISFNRNPQEFGPEKPSREDIVATFKGKTEHTGADMEKLQLFLQEQQSEAVRTHGVYACVKFSIDLISLYTDIDLLESAGETASAACAFINSELDRSEKSGGPVPQVLEDLGTKLQEALDKLAGLGE